jgi:hypothetical protein
MHEVFIVDAANYKDVETQLTKYRETLRLHTANVTEGGKKLQDLSVVTFK